MPCCWESTPNSRPSPSTCLQMALRYQLRWSKTRDNHLLENCHSIQIYKVSYVHGAAPLVQCMDCATVHGSPDRVKRLLCLPSRFQASRTKRIEVLYQDTRSI